MQAAQFDTRKTGIPSVGELPWGSRPCLFYDTKSDLLDVLVSYFKAGLQNNEFCCWVVHSPLSVEEVLDVLGQGVPGLADLKQSGQIEILSSDQWAIPVSETSRAIIAKLDQALIKGFDGLRLAFHSQTQQEAALDTSGMDAIAPLNVLALFLYPRHSFDAVGLMEVVKRHRLALVQGRHGWEVLESSEALTVKHALRRTEEKLHSLFNNMSEGFAYHRIILDPSGKPCDYIFLEINEAFARITGLDPVQVIGKRVTAALPGIERDPTDWIGKYGTVAVTGKPLQFEAFSDLLQRWFSVSAFSPHLGFFACTFADITERKQAESERRNMEERLAVTLRSIGDAVLSADAEGRITFLNPVAVALTGWAENEVLGLPAAEVFRIVNESSGEPCEDIIRQTLLERRTLALANQTALATRDGRLIPIEDSAAPIFTGDGRIAGAVLVFHDVTAKRRAQRELQRSHEELENRVAERTAQLRSANFHIEARVAQLRALASELTLAEQRERRRIARLLHDSLQQLLVGAKLRLNVLNHSTDATARDAGVSISGLLDEAIQASRSLTAEISPPILYEQGLVPALSWLARWIAEKHGLFVELSSETIPTRLAEGMSVLLFESIREILFNVVKHAGVDKAHVDVRCSEDRLLIAVLDRGSGFDPDSVRSSGASIGGFGLFSIRERLGLLGGELKIESAPGAGTRVTLIAPINPPSPIAGQGSDAHIRLLLVDDHPIMRDGLTRMFAQEPDIEVVGEASDGFTAIELAMKLVPDVVLMDMMMSGMGGVEATRLIRDQLPQVKVIGFSMLDDAEAIEAMLAAGASAHLSKSGPAEELLRAIRACLSAERTVSD